MKRCDAVECGVNKSGQCRLDKSPKSCLYRPQMEQLGELRKKVREFPAEVRKAHISAFFTGLAVGILLGAALVLFVILP